jgi:hypothetical protein
VKRIPRRYSEARIREGVRLSVRAERQKVVLPGNQIVSP